MWFCSDHSFLGKHIKSKESCKLHFVPCRQSGLGDDVRGGWYILIPGQFPFFKVQSETIIEDGSQGLSCQQVMWVVAVVVRQEGVELTDGHPEQDTSAEKEPQEGALTPK